MTRRLVRPITTIKEVVPDHFQQALYSLLGRVRDLEAAPVSTIRDPEAEASLKATQQMLEDTKSELDAAKAKSVEGVSAVVNQPPAEVAELLREGRSMGDAANELARRWAEFANLRQLNQELTPEQLAKEKRLQKALNWFQGDHSIEVV